MTILMYKDIYLTRQVIYKNITQQEEAMRKGQKILQEPQL